MQPAEASALRWEAAADGAAVILPVPAKAQGIVGGSLFCRAQQWSFLFRLHGKPLAHAQARIAVDEDVFEAAATSRPGTAEVRLPGEALGLLKDGTVMAVSLDGEAGALHARFPLAGSRTALEATAPRCSPPVLAGLAAVPLATEGEAANAAAPLVVGETELFAAASGRAPALAAGFVPAEGARKLLFASLCGSHRYYGGSGCKLMGFASEAGGAWKAVYESDGMHLFLDPRRSRDGWPDLVTVPVGDGEERLRWAFDSAVYATGEIGEFDDGPVVIDELRTSMTE